MISENLLGDVRKWHVGKIEYSATVIEVGMDTVKVKLATRSIDDDPDFPPGAGIVTWTRGELADHGFNLYE